MRTIVQTRHGGAADVLELADRPVPDHLPTGSALVRVRMVPIHRGDLQAIAASPAFGDPQSIAVGGRVPGLEGVGTIEALGDDVESDRGLRPGSRVVFFPVPGTWVDRVVVPAEALVPLEDAIPDEVAAGFLVNSLTAAIVVRAGHELLPDEHKTRKDVVVIQTAAASAVGRLISADLLRRGVKPIRLVRSRASAERLTALLPGGAVIATDEAGWQDRVRAAADPSKVHVALDAVGGDLLGDVAALVEKGGGIVSYGVLGGGQADIRPFVPRQLTLKGVTVVSWFTEADAVRRADVAMALTLAREKSELFPVGAVFPPERVREAVVAIENDGTTGSVLLDFRR